MAILFFGTALPVQIAIYSVTRMRALRPLKAALIAGFDRLSEPLGFSVLVVIGVMMIACEAFLLRAFVAPSDSWVMITLGLLWAIMGSVFRNREGGWSNRGRAVSQNRLS